jgi:UDP-N-acetylglucosamine transferase subunit ALG13
MIFVTVGAQMTFDRLIRAVDRWAGKRNRRDVLAQIGDGAYEPKHLEWTNFLDPVDFRQCVFESSVIITHAGMGTLLTALEFGRPVLVMPRRADLGETRNDHQFGTARAFASSGRVAVAWDEHELQATLDDLRELAAPRRIASHASFELLSALRRFVRHGAALPVEPIAGSAAPLAFPDQRETADEQPAKAA